MISRILIALPLAFYLNHIVIHYYEQGLGIWKSPKNSDAIWGTVSGIWAFFYGMFTYIGKIFGPNSILLWVMLLVTTAAVYFMIPIFEPYRIKILIGLILLPFVLSILSSISFG